MEVHGKLGCGFLEAVYQEAMAVEMGLRGIPFEREVNFQIYYKDQLLATHYRVDFVCCDDIIVELKALAEIGAVEISQAINYLKASGKTVGLVINFGAGKLEYKRVAGDKYSGTLHEHPSA